MVRHVDISHQICSANVKTVAFGFNSEFFAFSTLGCPENSGLSAGLGID